MMTHGKAASPVNITYRHIMKDLSDLVYNCFQAQNFKEIFFESDTKKINFYFTVLLLTLLKA